MTHWTCWLFCMLFIVVPVATEASQLIPIDASELQSLSDTIVVATVNKVERDPDNTIPKDITDYHIATVHIAFVLKGTVSTRNLRVRFASHGNRAFDPELTHGDTATFFLKKAEDGTYRTAYSGSVSLFPKGYFTPSKTADSEQDKSSLRGKPRR